MHSGKTTTKNPTKKSADKVSIAQELSQMDKIRKELCNCKEGNFSNKNKKSFWVGTVEIVVRRI